jgi:DNA-binding MarR family transcriptional regulator
MGAPVPARMGVIDTRRRIAEIRPMSCSQPYRLHASIMYQLTLTSRLQERRLDDGLRALGLTRIAWCILLAVRNEGIAQPSDIAEFIGVDRTACSRALRQMEGQGWIARRNGEPDRRTTCVEATPAGIALLEAATPVAEENSRHFLEKLDPGEDADLGRILARLREGEDKGLGQF